MSEIIFIVGNLFDGTCKNKSVISLSDFKNITHPPLDVTYMLGQGISQDDLSSMRYKNPKKYSMIGNPEVLIKNKYLAHKNDVKNCHIGSPEKIACNVYKAALMIDSNCCELSDHLTGQHISGSILVEAARQASVAVIEKHYQSKVGSHYFILKKSTSKFNNFVFPLPAEVKCIVSTSDGRKDFEVKSQIYHVVDEVLCEFDITISVQPKNIVNRFESRSAESVIKKCTKEYI